MEGTKWENLIRHPVLQEMLPVCVWDCSDPAVGPHPLLCCFEICVVPPLASLPSILRLQLTAPTPHPAPHHHRNCPGESVLGTETSLGGDSNKSNVCVAPPMPSAHPRHSHVHAMLGTPSWAGAVPWSPGSFI